VNAEGWKKASEGTLRGKGRKTGVQKGFRVLISTRKRVHNVERTILLLLGLSISSNLAIAYFNEFFVRYLSELPLFHDLCLVLSFLLHRLFVPNRQFCLQ
jgi:hypothetical protein